MCFLMEWSFFVPCAAHSVAGVFCFVLFFPFILFKDKFHKLFKMPKYIASLVGFPCASVGKECACNAGDWFNPWVGKIPWRRERLPTPVFWPGEFHGQYSPWD